MKILKTKRVEMGKELRMSDYMDDGEDGGGDEEYSVPEWEIGLPSGDDLTPLSQSLVPSILALAFSIIPERSRTIRDVNRASRNTLSSLSCCSNGSSGAIVSSVVDVEVVDRVGSSSSGSDPKKQKKSEAAVEDSMAEKEGDSGTEDASEKTLKRPRLVWTPQLHKRFVDVVAHLGIKSAVSKTIMQLMNVEGLTRENVASHLQKYRVYLKRIQELTNDEGPYSSDQLFSSTPVPPPSFQDGGGTNGATGKLGIPIPVPSMMPMPVYGNHMGMQGHYHQYRNHGNEPNQYMMQHNRFGTMVTSPSVGGGDVNGK